MKEFARVCCRCKYFYGCSYCYEKVVRFECIDCKDFLEYCDVKLKISFRKIEITHGICTECLPGVVKEIEENLRKEEMAK